MLNKKIIAGVALLAGTVLSSQTALAATSSQVANPASLTTGVHSTLSAPSSSTLPPLPGGSTGPGGSAGGPATSSFQMAYVPVDWHFIGDTTDTTITATDGTPAATPITSGHVGVLDNTYAQKGWDVEAELQWTGTAMTGATIDVNLGTVQENSTGTPTTLPSHLASAFNNTLGSASVAPSVGSNVARIATGGTTAIMAAQDGFTYGGTYDVEVTNPTLNVPAGAAAGSYNGNIVWTLTAHP